MSFSDEKKEKKQDEQAAPVPEAKAPEAAPAPAEVAKATEAAPQKKGFTPKSTRTEKPAQCAGCGKNLKKKLWHYRNGAYYCNDRCFRKKVAEDAKKAAAAAEKAKADAAK